MKLRAATVLVALLTMNACGGGGGGPSGPVTTTGSVRGTVTDQNAAAVATATVTLSATGQSNRTALTTATGSYTFSNVAAGVYTVSVTPPATGFLQGNGTASITVVAGQQANVPAIVLTRQVSGPAPMAATVSMTDNLFTPSSVEVAIGGTVTWENDGLVAHNATGGGGINTGDMNPGASRNETFAAAGNFAYSCTIHPGMSGTVIVR